MKKSSIIAISIVVVFLGILTLNVIKLIEKKDGDNTQTQYIQGLEFIAKKDLQNAYYNFGKVPRKSPLWIASIYRQASCAYELNDYNSAIRHYHSFIRTSNDESIVPIGYYELALSYLGKKQPRRARQVFETLIKKFPESDFAHAANFHLAELYTKNKLHDKDFIKAKKHYIEYLKEAPAGKYAYNCINMLSQMQIPLSEEEKLAIGISAYELGEYTKSTVYLKEAPFEKAWFYLAKAYQKLDNPQSATQTFLEGLKKHSSSLSEKELSEAVLGYVTTSGLEEEKAYNKLASEMNVKNNKTYGVALYNLARFLPKSQALKNYHTVAKMFPGTKWASESLWKLFWNAYSRNDTQNALQYGRIHINKYENYPNNPKILYWCGKILHKKHKYKEARLFYEKVLKDYPQSYYAYRASSQLKESPQGWATNSENVLAQENLEPLIFEENSVLKHLAMVNDIELIEKMRIHDKFIQSWIALKQGKVVYSINLAKEGLEENKLASNDERMKLAYPIHYADLVDSYGKRRRLDPYLVMSLIREESTFDPNAKSHAGAIGLMQLMPETASYVCNNEKICTSNQYNLREAKDNVALGTAYFSYLLSKLNYSELLATLSYNGGPGAVVRWQKIMKYADYDEFVEKIPYDETRNYAKRVFGSYWNYRKIYGKSK